jgi:hypothetical protein
VAVGACVGKGPIHQMKNICARGHNSWPCGDEGYHFCPYWSCISWAAWHWATDLALLQKGTTTPNCSQGTCNPVNFTVLKLSDWTQGQIISIKIDGQGLDLGVCYTLS